MLWRTATNAVASRSLSCDQLPATIEAEAFMTDHKSFLDRIEAVNPGGVFVHVTAEEACPGRAILTIAYATESDRKTIEAILRDSPGNSRPVLWQFPRLFGIPYRLVNT